MQLAGAAGISYLSFIWLIAWLRDFWKVQNTPFDLIFEPALGFKGVLKAYYLVCELDWSNY